MISRYTVQQYTEALKSLEIPKNAVVLTSVSFYNLGALEGNLDRTSYIEAHCKGLMEVLGPGATLVANTYTSYVGRFGHPFVWESTTTTTGAFNEWVLKHPLRQRTLHPLRSVAAIGPLAEQICKDVRNVNYGIETPYDRMASLDNAYILRIGIEPYFNAFTHQAEALVGVPYWYLKILDAKVLKNGQEINGPWLSYVRYLHFDFDYNFNELKKAVTEAGLIRSKQVGAGTISLLKAKPYLDLVMSRLVKDPYFLVGGEIEVPVGQPPRDGNSAVRDGVHLDRIQFEEQRDQ
jgi:aminoglycoside 3-N-acetyltransferase